MWTMTIRSAFLLNTGVHSHCICIWAKQIANVTWPSWAWQVGSGNLCDCNEQKMHTLTGCILQNSQTKTWNSLISHQSEIRWSKHNRHIVILEESRSIKLTYCIWWNSWVLTSASCFSCNFLSVSPPNDLYTALPPRGTEGQWSPYIKNSYHLWSH